MDVCEMIVLVLMSVACLYCANVSADYNRVRSSLSGKAAEAFTVWRKYKNKNKKQGGSQDVLAGSRSFLDFKDKKEHKSSVKLTVNTPSLHSVDVRLALIQHEARVYILWQPPFVLVRVPLGLLS